MGAGAWGTALAKVLADAGNNVTLWARSAEVAREINETHRNSKYLGDRALPASIKATADPAEALTGACTVLLAVPSQTLRTNLSAWTGYLGDDTTLVSVAKGIELDNLLRMSQVIVQVTGADPSRVAVLSGPNLASEVVDEQPAATLIACTDSGRAVALQRAFATGYFRPYTNADVIGAEIGGACKNVIALACGVAAGLGYGDNTLATLITRGLAEMGRLGAALGADPMTFAGLAGLGDLVATCSSPLSRNRSFGYRLGAGDTVEKAQQSTHGQVAEGVKSSLSIQGLAARCGVEVPITDGVRRVCYDGQSPRQMAAELLGRAHKPE